MTLVFYNQPMDGPAAHLSMFLQGALYRNISTFNILKYPEPLTSIAECIQGYLSFTEPGTGSVQIYYTMHEY
jgi:hypothetical protein